jgi:hypothetical protein
MISTETLLIRPKTQPRSPPNKPQAKKAQQRDQHDADHEIARHHVGQPLHGSLGALGLGDHLDDLRQHGLGADVFGADDQAAGGIERRADHLVAGALGYRQRLSGQHRLIHRAAAFGHFPIHRHLLAGPDPQQVADMNMSSGERLPRCHPGPDAARRLRRQTEQAI